MSRDDLDIVQKFLENQQIKVLNTRAFKEDDKFSITVASIEDHKSREDIEFMGKQFQIKYGEFSPYLTECVHYLNAALAYCSSGEQRQMIQQHIRQFESGNIGVNLDSQKFEGEDQGSAVICNMGLTQTFIDPEKVRGFF